MINCPYKLYLQLPATLIDVSITVSNGDSISNNTSIGIGAGIGICNGIGIRVSFGIGIGSVSVSELVHVMLVLAHVSPPFFPFPSVSFNSYKALNRKIHHFQSIAINS